ncbi:hypothetical protein DYB32_010301 [Aphanomyces invadans]|uniref:Uncharacterized protein n=1 Tax=Aphanomyces invadans TaxID=157072 RepID=A0A3R6V2Z2_9STRA|nr:hypothetical protein DYB32_010301 [Aphanomyces invadans]
MSCEHGNADSINGKVKPSRSKRQPSVGVGNKSGDESSKSAPTKAPKPKGTSQNTKFREAGGHAVADDDIPRCEAVADAFYKNPEDKDAFIEDILLIPHSQVYELTVRLGEGYRDWKEKTLCSQFVKENPGSLWGDPQTRPRYHGHFVLQLGNLYRDGWIHVQA